jgi:hypothetical protein
MTILLAAAAAEVATEKNDADRLRIHDVQCSLIKPVVYPRIEKYLKREFESVKLG